MHFAKQCFGAAGHVILSIVNTSLATGIVPESWKLSIVRPINKSAGALNDPSSFRPISIVQCLEKIVECVVHQQLFTYFSTNHLLSDTQHGFRPRHSTETALLSVTDHALSAMDAGKIALLVPLDVSKGFDVVYHEKLLEKVVLYGVHTEWFASYFRDHHQQVRLNTPGNGLQLSEKRPNPIGVYQGTALGPLMFSIFVNDMSLFTYSDVLITQYADDTQVLRPQSRTGYASQPYGERPEGLVRMV